MAERRRRGDSWAQWHTAAWGRTVDGGARGCAGGRRRRRGGGLAERREARFFPCKFPGGLSHLVHRRFVLL
ncbi:Os01g0823951, partial [Oryza sativa Japonica Group]